MLVLLFIFSLFCYGFWVEPKTQGVKYDTVRIDNLPPSWENAKIAFFSDTNFGARYTLDSLNKTVKRINEAKPDIIIFAGHFFDANAGKNMMGTLSAEIEKTLLALEAPLGKFAVLTELNEPDQAIELLTAADFQVLTNEHRALYRYNLEPLNLIAINKNITATKKTELLDSSKDAPSLLLDENANNFKDLGTFPTIQFMFSYSTYGGFIGIPYLNKVIAQTDYPSGFHQNNNQTLLVSNGIGTPPYAYFRLFNYPTLYIVTIQQRK